MIHNIVVHNRGYVHCKSNFYSVQDVLSDCSNYTFTTGINKMIGEIDSGIWAVSYLLSMYKYRPEEFILFEQPQIVINNESIPLDESSKLSCYMDKLYPLFSTSNSVKDLIIQGLEYSRFNYSPNDIRELFCIHNERFERPLTGIGNEIFKAMAAIGYCYRKEIFCFPWLSSKRFEGYHANLSVLLKILESLNKIVILPVGITSH